MGRRVLRGLLLGIVMVGAWLAVPAIAGAYTLTICANGCTPKSFDTATSSAADGTVTTTFAATADGAMLPVSTIDSADGDIDIVAGANGTASTIEIASGAFPQTAAANLTFDAAATTLDGTTTMSGTVTFHGDLDADSTVDGAADLQIDGNATFDAAVGENTPLASLEVDGTATVDGSVSAETQDYAGAVSLGTGNITFSAPTQLTFSGTVLPDAGNAPDVTIAAGGQPVSVGTNLGDPANPLGSLTVEPGTTLTTTTALTVVASGDVDMPDGGTIGGALAVASTSGDVDLENATAASSLRVAALYVATLGADSAASVTVDDSPTGLTEIDGNISAETGGSVFGEAVQLQGDPSFTGPTTFLSALDDDPSDAEPASPTFDAVVFDGPVGATDELDNLFVNGSATVDGSVNTTLGQDYEGDVTVPSGDSATFDAGQGTAIAGLLSGPGSVSFTGAGSVLLNGTASSPTEPAALTDSATGTTVLAGNLFTSGALTVSGPLSLQADVTMQSGGVLSLGSVDGAFALTADGAAGTDLTGAIGATTRLTSLAVTGSATAELMTPSIDTSGAQTFGPAVQLAGPVTLAGSKLTFSSTVDALRDDPDSPAAALSLDGPTVFDGDVGMGTALVGLDAHDPVTLAGAAYAIDAENSLQLEDGVDITTTGGGATDLDSYSGAVDIAGTTTLGQASSELAIGAAQASTLNGTVTGPGGLILAGAARVDLTGANSFDGGIVVDAGTLAYAGASSLNENTVTLDGGAVDATSDISGELAVGSAGGTVQVDSGNKVQFATPLSNVAGTLTKTGAGALTLAAAESYTQDTDVDGGSLVVPSGGSLTGSVIVASAGALACDDGTLNGGVQNSGGTLSGGPATPTNVMAIPGDQSTSVAFTAGDPGCYPISYTATASPGSEQASGTGSPITVGGLTDGTQYAFAVTATNPIGNASSSSSSTVTPEGANPTAKITTPAGGGGTYTQGQTVQTAYTCTAGANGPSITSCADNNGGTGGTGTLPTSQTGQNTYTVTATAKDGQTGTAQITYTVDPRPAGGGGSPPSSTTSTTTTTSTPPSTSTTITTTGTTTSTTTSTTTRTSSTATSTSTATPPPSNAFTIRGRPSLLPNGQITLAPTLPGPGQLTITITANGPHHEHHTLLQARSTPGQFLYARTVRHITRHGTLKLTIGPSRKQLATARHDHSTTYTITITYQPTHGRSRTVTETIHIHPRPA